MASKVIISLLFVFLCIHLEIQCSTSNSWIKAGYYYLEHELAVSDINSALFSHLLFAFVSVNLSSYKLSINSSDSHKFSTFTDIVRRKNPSVTTILSIRVGREQSTNFFSNLSQPSHRKSFIESSITTARLNGYDGLDLSGVELNAGLNKTILGTLMAEWRVAIDSEAKDRNRPRLLLVMSGQHVPILDSVSYPIEAMQNNLDWVHLQSYDYHVPTKTNLTYPQAALYGPSNQGINTNNGIQEWINRGFPASKLVLGLPYHGYAWILVDPNDSTVGALASGPAVTKDGSMAYGLIKWFIRTRSNGCGADSTYNDTYVVNFCTVGQIWMNFDDVEAIRAKVSYAKKMGLLGYNVFQVGNDDNWVLSRAANEEGGDHQQNKKKLVTIILITIAMFILLLVVILCLLQWKVFNPTGIIGILKRSLYKLRRIISAAENLNNHGSNLQVLSYMTVKNATDNFSSQNKLGEGGYGPVYKGKLRKGQEIAVKRLSKTSNQGHEEFKNEVILTANLQHVNLVKVLGYCTEREEKMLIYEHMPNNSLDTYLFDPARRHVLDWHKRVNIIEGIIQGLLYLQEYSNFTIIHRDIKASNILLDHQMNPKISDFGMARVFSKNELEANTGRIVGTYGYVPPEYVKRGIYSMKYDVYSFGVLLLQIISGKRITCLHGLSGNLNLMEYAFELWMDGQGMQFIESTLDDSSSSCKILRCMQVALLCVQENPVDRPSMLMVSLMLKNEAAAIVTPKKPAFSIREDHELQICSVNYASISEDWPR